MQLAQHPDALAARASAAPLIRLALGAIAVCAVAFVATAAVDPLEELVAPAVRSGAAFSPSRIGIGGTEQAADTVAPIDYLPARLHVQAGYDPLPQPQAF